MFVIEKIRVEKGKDSAISAGRSFRAHCAAAHSNGVSRRIDSLTSVKVGDQIVLGWGVMNTSAIAEILLQDDDYIRFRTQTSEYEMKKEPDDEPINSDSNSKSSIL